MLELQRLMELNDCSILSIEGYIEEHVLELQRLMENLISLNSYYHEFYSTLTPEVAIPFNLVSPLKKDLTHSEILSAPISNPLPGKTNTNTSSDSDMYGSSESSIKPQHLNDEVWDYILCDGTLPKSRDISSSLLEIMKFDFDYWYPFDFHFSGKDLIQNHLTFCIYSHTTIMPKH
ncbi:unnamed protein product [Vicia faba]|uniref:Uncharacterized protein n=1 Tax=Vicia faba TaxID=3906 RepID=A0AAV0ZTH8_VICFA|nr:unnamed protein product [Vicia faba]